MMKIPEPKTIAFGEVPYSFNGRLGLLGHRFRSERLRLSTQCLLQRF